MVYSDCHVIRSSIGLRFDIDSRSFGVQIRDLSDLLVRYNIVLSSVVLRRSVLRQLDFHFDDNLCVSEETDLFLRIAQNTLIARNRERLTVYRVHSNSESYKAPFQFFREAQIIKNRIRHSFFMQPPASSLRRFRLNAVWSQAYFHWIRGDGASCRRILRRVFSGSPREWKLFVVSFLPKSLVSGLLRTFGTTVPD